MKNSCSDLGHVICDSEFSSVHLHILLSSLCLILYVSNTKYSMMFQSISVLLYLDSQQLKVFTYTWSWESVTFLLQWSYSSEASNHSYWYMCWFSKESLHWFSDFQSQDHVKRMRCCYWVCHLQRVSFQLHIRALHLWVIASCEKIIMRSLLKWEFQQIISSWECLSSSW